MATLEQTIRNIVTGSGGISTSSKFVVASRDNSDVEAFDVAKAELPLFIYLDELRVNGEVLQNANFKETQTVVISILYQDEFDDSDEDTFQTEYQQAKTLAEKLIARLQIESIVIDTITFSINPLNKEFNSMLSGCMLNMQVPIYKQVDYC